MGSYTIKDIARELNISPSTVSRALRDHPDISPGTKEKVRTLAEKWKYSPNPFAVGLQQKKSKIIGVIVPQVKHYFFAAIMSGITDVAYQAGYTVLICQSNENYEREVINTGVLISHRVAGLLVSLSQATKKYDHFKSFSHHDIPLVFFDRVAEDVDAGKVVVDDYNGAFQAVTHLIDSGYRRIAHLAGPQNLSIGRNRLNGYRDALEHRGMAVDEELVIFGGLNEEDGISGFQTLLNKNGPLPDAIFAITDPVAVGVYTQLKKNGYKIPGDIALLGFSDNPIASLLEPALTTVRQPAYNIGKVSTTLLLEQIDGQNSGKETKTIVLKTELIVREST